MSSLQNILNKIRADSGLLGPFDIKETGDWESIKSVLGKGYECVIYKYSSSCPISSGTGKTFERWAEKIPRSANILLARINVPDAKDLVDLVAEDLILTHHSPQIIWIDEDLDVRWHASHYDITVSALRKYLQKYLEI